MGVNGVTESRGIRLGLGPSHVDGLRSGDLHRSLFIG